MLALAAWTPFLVDWVASGDSSGHLQSIVLGAVLFISAVQLFALGVIADLIGSHRTVTQRTLERVRRIELELGVPPVALRAGPHRAHGRQLVTPGIGSLANICCALNWPPMSMSPGPR